MLCSLNINRFRAANNPFNGFAIVITNIGGATGHQTTRAILGLNADMFVDYMQYIANRRMEGLGMSFRYEKDRNPFPWLAEKIDMKKQKNFFETKVTDYQHEAVLSDDF